MADKKPASLLTTLVDEHYLLVYRYAFRLCGKQADAEDLTQQTFLAAGTHAGQLRDPKAARSWLCSIARNAYLQSRRRQDVVLPPSETVEAKVPELPVGGIEEHELQSALNELPEEFRTAIVLFYFQQFSYKQIAEVMELPLGTVMSRLSRGKAWLRKRLGTESPSTPVETLAEPITTPF